MSMKQFYKQESGAISLLTVIILAIILSIITTGLLRLSIQDARSAIDDDLSNRAFFAAESGVNDAVRYINYQQLNNLDEDTLNGEECAIPSVSDYPFVTVDESTLSGVNPDGATPNAFDTAYTCQLIDITPESFESNATESAAAQVPLSFGGDNPDGITIEWHRLGADGADQAYGSLRGSGDDVLPTATNWDAPGMLRVNLFSSPTGASFTRAQLANDVVFLKPSDTDDGATITAGNDTDDGQIINGNCLTAAAAAVSTAEYACSATINISDITSREYYLRVKSLYKDAKFRVTFNTPAAGTTTFEKSQAVVDVTGRASDVYRRIEARVDLTSGTSALLPDYSIESAGEICKQLNVASDVIDICP